MIKTYPIYSIRLSFVQDDLFDQNNDIYDRSREGLPKGRMKNSLSYHYRMFRKRPDFIVLKQEYEKIFYQTLDSNKEYPIKNPTDLEIKINLYDYEEWCPTWFSHYILDNGQSDEEILKSFEEYVWRIQRRNQDEGHMNVQGYWQETYCLMGAEDRWRWRAATDNGDNNEDPDKYPPPCRCNGCKERGVIVINH